MFDWDGFKRTEFAVSCDLNKNDFFNDCKINGVYVYLSDFAKQRNLFICAKRYENQHSPGRYEVFALEGWETKPKGLYGVSGLQEVIYTRGV